MIAGSEMRPVTVDTVQVSEYSSPAVELPSRVMTTFGVGMSGKGGSNAMSYVY